MINIINRLKRSVILILKEVNESLWFFGANHLPRINLFNMIRSRFIACGGVKIGRNVTIWSGFDTRPIGYAHNLTIGSNVFINRHFRCAAPVGPNVSIETVNHNISWNKEEAWGGKGCSTTIMERCWIGAGATILGGVTIGPDSVVAAGSVVIKNVPPNVVVAGIPARIIKRST